MKKLSEKQKLIISFIDRFISDNGFPPSIRDIQGGCRISSTSVVDYNLRILGERGIIERHADVSRGIRMLTRDSTRESTISVPIIGLISAGEPIPVPTPDTWDVAAVSETMDVPRNLTRGKDNVYALRVKGQSMIDALIDDGDIILLQNVNSVDNGEMAAVWLRGEKEATLKKVYLEGSRVRLQPANSQMQPFYAEADDVEIQGRVIAVLRHLA
ncbi:MAG: transcriptional repressor LexA [Dehalococcoidales bacterium]|nr:transcriptional repressor LexA [Dehalococcoidales bacterium]